MQIVSVQIGKPKTYGNSNSSDPMEKEWTTAFYKVPTSDLVSVAVLGIDGDGVADPKHHGGIDKAVLAYSSDRYEFWQSKLQSKQIDVGGFGENLSISGGDESNVCIGDRFEIGSAILEVSQPREPCWKLGRRWQEKMLPKYVVQTGYTGWYFRVARPGQLKIGDSVKLVDRPNPTWTIERANDVLYGRIVDATISTELFLLPQLSVSWKKSLN